MTAPFCGLTHFAPYNYCTGFNLYWLKHNKKLNITSPKTFNEKMQWLKLIVMVAISGYMLAEYMPLSVSTNISLLLIATVLYKDVKSKDMTT